MTAYTFAGPVLFPQGLVFTLLGYSIWAFVYYGIFLVAAGILILAVWAFWFEVDEEEFLAESVLNEALEDVERVIPLDNSQRDRFKDYFWNRLKNGPKQ